MGVHLLVLLHVVMGLYDIKVKVRMLVSVSHGSDREIPFHIHSQRQRTIADVVEAHAMLYIELE